MLARPRKIVRKPKVPSRFGLSPNQPVKTDGDYRQQKISFKQKLSIKSQCSQNQKPRPAIAERGLENDVSPDFLQGRVMVCLLQRYFREGVGSVFGLVYRGFEVVEAAVEVVARAGQADFQ